MAGPMQRLGGACGYAGVTTSVTVIAVDRRRVWEAGKKRRAMRKGRVTWRAPVRCSLADESVCACRPIRTRWTQRRQSLSGLSAPALAVFDSCVYVLYYTVLSCTVL